MTSADSTMLVIAATTTAASAVAGGGNGCGRVLWRRRAVAEGLQKIAKANWQFHPPARRRVFDAVLKHGWPSEPCHGTNMAGKNLKPLHLDTISVIRRTQNTMYDTTYLFPPCMQEMKASTPAQARPGDRQLSPTYYFIIRVILFLNLQ